MSAMRSASSITRMPTWSRSSSLALEQVDHAARRRDRDLDALLQVADLLVERRAAVERGDAACRVSLPSGASTSTTCLASSRVGTSTSAVGWPGLAAVDGLQHRQPEGERLARAGAGLAAHVVAGERVGDGGLLDGEGVVDALGREGVDELGPRPRSGTSSR